MNNYQILHLGGKKNDVQIVQCYPLVVIHHIACFYKLKEIFSLREIPTQSGQGSDPTNMTQTYGIVHKKDVLHFRSFRHASCTLLEIPGDEVQIEK